MSMSVSEELASERAEVREASSALEMKCSLFRITNGERGRFACS